MIKAHNISSKKRTADVNTDGTTDFGTLLLSPKVLEGLQLAGFHQPSPIQIEAIPLAKCGLDLVCQAKSGTGKTLVFAVCALEAVYTESKATQVLILAPTREIAHQIHCVITTVGATLPGLRCCLLIGGIPVEKDIQGLEVCHIAIGTPGRVKHLIENKHLSTDSIRLFVLDEADKLLEEGSFQEQINWIFSTLGQHKQVVALSATYPEYLATFLNNYMFEPIHVRINPQDLTLKGIHQYYTTVSSHNLPHKSFQNKCFKLMEIIKRIPFQQSMIFSNYQKRAEQLSKWLTNEGWPCTYIAGCQQQAARLQAMDQLKSYKCRILVTTDLTSRGIDCDKVNLVINLDLPWDIETYLHRIGRAGRFGSYGLAISIVTEGEELKKLQCIGDTTAKPISLLPDDLENVSSEMRQQITNEMSIDGNVSNENTQVESCDLNGLTSVTSSEMIGCNVLQASEEQSTTDLNPMDVLITQTVNSSADENKVEENNRFHPDFDPKSIGDLSLKCLNLNEEHSNISNESGEHEKSKDEKKQYKDDPNKNKPVESDLNLTDRKLPKYLSFFKKSFKQNNRDIKSGPKSKKGDQKSTNAATENDVTKFNKNNIEQVAVVKDVETNSKGDVSISLGGCKLAEISAVVRNHHVATSLTENLNSTMQSGDAPHQGIKLKHGTKKKWPFNVMGVSLPSLDLNLSECVPHNSNKNSNEENDSSEANRTIIFRRPANDETQDDYHESDGETNEYEGDFESESESEYDSFENSFQRQQMSSKATVNECEHLHEPYENFPSTSFSDEIYTSSAESSDEEQDFDDDGEQSSDKTRRDGWNYEYFTECYIRAYHRHVALLQAQHFIYQTQFL